MPSEHARVSPIPVGYIPDGKKHLLFFRLRSNSDLESLRGLFEFLANGTRREIRLVEERIVSVPDSLREIRFLLISVEKSKLPWVRIAKSGAGKHEISWRRDREGWLESLELLASLTPGTHQYFNYSDISDVSIEASFLEN